MHTMLSEIGSCTSQDRVAQIFQRLQNSCLQNGRMK